MNRNICVIGMGYIGLPTACILAESGFKVVGVDINKEIVSNLNSGKINIKEPELKEYFLRAFKKKNLIISENIKRSDVYIISVPTPLDKNNKANLDYVIGAVKEISKYLKKGDLVILESTSPPDTTENVVGKILDETNLQKGKDYFLAFCPERVLLGRVLYELINNDRVIGGINRESAKLAREIYSGFVKGRIYITDLKTAEMVKLVENAFRDVNIAFSNELSMICSDYGINVWEVIKYANMHPRVNILKPGPGVGGHCIPIDPWFILQNANIRDTLIEKSRKINNNIPFVVSNKVMKIVEGIKEPKVTLFGASYKGNVEDTRESPSQIIYEVLINKGVEVFVFDPIAKGFKYELSGLEDSVRDSDLIVLLVDHESYNELSIKKISNLMRKRNILDTKNFFNEKELKRYNFSCFKL